jgi:hypothetical protein
MTKHRGTQLSVDGEIFEIVPPSSDGHRFTYTWLTGRNRGYGFTSHAFGDVEDPERTHATAIRSFLHQIDPATGFISDDDESDDDTD